MSFDKLAPSEFMQMLVSALAGTAGSFGVSFEHGTQLIREVNPMKCLTPQQRITLMEARDPPPKPYVRERSAAILKVAAGPYFQEVAHHGLLRPHAPNT